MKLIKILITLLALANSYMLAQNPWPKPTSQGNTIGDTVPVIYDNLWLSQADMMAALTGAQEDVNYRTNLQLTWIGGQVDFDVAFYAANGTLLGHLTESTKNIYGGGNNGAYQYNKVISGVNTTYSGIYSMIIKVIKGPGKIFFYISTIDNHTGSPVITGQQRYASDGSVWAANGRFK